MTTTDKASSRGQSEGFEAGLAAAARLLRDTASAKESRSLDAIGAMFADPTAADLRAAADRVEALSAPGWLHAAARQELPGDTLALACRIWGDHWAPNEIPGLIEFGDAYAAAVAPPITVAPDRAQGRAWTDNMGPAAFTADRLIALAAFGYALGRATYMPSHVASWLMAHKHLLSDHDRRRIIGDIDRAAELTQLGMDCDVETWSRLRTALLPEGAR